MGSRKQKWLALILIAVLAVTTATGGVYAYLSAQTGPVENTLTAAEAPDIGIEENFPGGTNPVKSNVCVDVGDPGYAVYVRVAIVVTWQNASGEVYGQLPVAGTDYSISLNTGNNAPWFYNSADGFYYLKAMVTSGKTAALIESCSQTAEAPKGYTLHVEIVAQTIQALGETDGNNPVPAVTAAWGIAVDANGNLKSN